jgi:hypothetical protein
MRARVVGVATAAAAVATIAVTRSRRRRSAPGSGGTSAPRSGWYGVTINRDADEMMPDGVLPAPLAALGNEIEVEVRGAPGDKGSELRARFRGTSSPDHESVGRVRAALRQSKQLIEVGEVLRVDPVPHGRRTHTPTGAVVDRLTARSDEEGTL